MQRSPRYRVAASASLLALLWLSVGFLRARYSAPPPFVPAIRDAPPTPMRGMFEARLDSLAIALHSLAAAIGDQRLEPARSAFRNARRLYKESEFLLAFYAPAATNALNGPVEADDPDLPATPLGARASFAVVEHALFGDTVAVGRGAALTASHSMLRSLRSFRDATHLLDISDTASLDAARLELARVSTLGIAGFDSDESGDALIESAAAIDGVADAIARLQTSRIPEPALARAATALRAASMELRAHPAFDELDRLDFVVRYGTPSARAVLALRRSIDARPVAARRLWRPAIATPFEAGAFDVSALAPEYAPKSSAALVALGEQLFADAQLSGARNRSCASCHQRSLAFTDGQARAATVSSSGQQLRNTPTLINAALQPFMFADQRAGYVEDQIRVVLSSDAEMASSPQLAAKRVAADSSYLSQLRALGQPPAAVDERLIRVALAAYVRSLVALNSPFDRAIRGDTVAISSSARRGFNLFMGKARCGTCHFAPLFGGTMPPDFIRSELEIIGAPTTPATHNARLDADEGRARVDGAFVHRAAFRVPSVRNSAVTAPYMHNGVYRTLDQVIDFYDRGGGAGIGESVSAQTLSLRPLHLTPTERADLLSFLRALTDTAVATTVVSKP
ncbi:MAG: cytochrome c peroxidase [bacterium]